MDSSPAKSLQGAGLIKAWLSRTHFLKILLVWIQLGLVFWIMDAYAIETEQGLTRRILALTLGGFFVHALLPLRWRLPFFFVLTLAAIGLMFPVSDALWLLGVGVTLILLCHLPLRIWIRAGIILMAGGVLIGFRAAWIDSPMSGAALAVLGSIFMFRIVLYLLDSGNEKEKATIWERLSYFFMLPNIIFPFFPIVDYITFRRTYYDAEDHRIYQKGVVWIFRGVIHLLLYRFVYYYLSPAEDDIQHLSGVVMYIVSSYLLYLRVSGLFHLIIGLMCLFGFNLPETHRLYFLASSFNDYWRRINIYWKNFMMRVFFYPLYMKIRHWGSTQALVFSTLIVFLCTWLLHSYQWFWLQGAFPVTLVDGAYWGVLGVLVAVNSVWEAKKGKTSRKAGAQSVTDLFRLAFQTTITLIFLSIMWSFWSSESAVRWWYVMQIAGTASLKEYAVVALGVLGVFTIVFAYLYLNRQKGAKHKDDLDGSFYHVAMRTGTVALLVIGIGLPNISNRLHPKMSVFVASLQENRLNDEDRDLRERGYYEGLIDGESGNLTAFGRAKRFEKPATWKATMNSASVQPATDALMYELKPSFSGIVKEAPFETNRWGMRDDEHTIEKDSGSFRIALLGASYEQGAGVPNDKIFPALLETYLNESNSSESHQRIEVLNFAVGGYSSVQLAYVAEHKILEFDPDLILYNLYSTEQKRLLMQLQLLSYEKRELSLEYLDAVYEKAGVTNEVPDDEARRRLKPFSEKIVRRSFMHIRDVAKQHEIPVIAVFVPTTEEIEGYDGEWHPKLNRLARDAGFQIIDLQGAYDGYDPKDIQLRPWDTHPNEEGHELIARRLYNELLPIIGK